GRVDHAPHPRPRRRRCRRDRRHPRRATRRPLRQGAVRERRATAARGIRRGVTMTRMPLPERLALRRARRDWRGTVLAAVFLAVPFTAHIVVNITSTASATATDLTVGTSVVLLPLIVAIAVMVGANALVATRRDERMLALLRSAGASRGSLFRFVSASGVLTGLAAAVASVIVGIPVAWLWLGQVTVVAPGPVAGIAVLCLVLGWATSVAAGVVASTVDANRVLRGLPRKTDGQWRTDRIGAVLVCIGIAR